MQGPFFVGSEVIMNKNSILTMSYLTNEQILKLLQDAQAFSCSQKDWQLSKPRLVANLFLSQALELIIPLPAPNIKSAAK